MNKYLTKSYVLRSLFWGFFMFVFMGIFLPMSQDETLEARTLIIKLLYWIAGGFLCMLTIDIVNRKVDKKRTSKT